MVGEILSGLDAQAVPMSAPDHPAAHLGSLRRWQRFTPARADRCARPSISSSLIAVVWSLQTIEIIPEFLYDAPQQTVDLFARMWPIDWAWYPKVVHAALIETLHIADARHDPRGRDREPRRAHGRAQHHALGRRSTPSAASSWSRRARCTRWSGRCSSSRCSARARWPARWRSPSHSIGFTGKFLSEAIEEAKPGPIEALVAAGALAACAC